MDKRLTSFERFGNNVTHSLPKLSCELMDKWSENPDALKDVLSKALETFPESKYPFYPVTVDFSRSVKEMIEEGEYDKVNRDITARHFHSTDKDKVRENIRLIRFEPGLRSTEDVILELDRRGLRSVVLKELLALGATYKDIQLSYGIVALGSVWYDGKLHEAPKVACLLSTDLHSYRELDLYDNDGSWTSEWRFAAVPKGT